MNHLKPCLSNVCLSSALLFVSQSVETQEDPDVKTSAKVLHRLAQRPLQGKLFREEQKFTRESP